MSDNPDTSPSGTAGPLIGLCGLGNMGSALASRLGGRFRVIGFDTDADRAGATQRESGIAKADSLDALAPCNLVLLCLPEPGISRSVVQALAPQLAPGSVIVEMSTVTPADVVAYQEFCEPTGVGLIDAAIAAGVGQIRAGSGALLIGGRDDDIDRAWPVLTAVTERAYRLGALGSGAALKVINNAVAHGVMVVLVEAAAMAAAAGVARADLIRLMTGPDAGLLRPLEHRLMERIACGDYDGGMPTDAARKDSTLALAMAQQLHVPLFAIQASHIVYELAVAEGHGRLDYASIAKLWETWIGQDLSVTDGEHA